MVTENGSKLVSENRDRDWSPHDVIGGLHLGWNVAVSVREKFAFPFCTGKSPSAAFPLGLGLASRLVEQRFG